MLGRLLDLAVIFGACACAFGLLALLDRKGNRDA